MPQQQVAGVPPQRVKSTRPPRVYMWPNAAWQDFSGEFHGPEDSFKKVSTLFQTANRFARRALGWNTAPRPVSASWPGIAMVAKNVANVTASLKVWEEAARNYSFIGGGLGYAGRVNDGKFFLEMCRFGSHSSDACCNKNADPSFQNLADAFKEPDVQSRQTDVTFTAAAPLRAWLANNLGLNPFFNGDTRSPRMRMSPRLTHPGRSHTPRACGCPRRCVYVPCALHLRSTLVCLRRVAGDGYTYDGCYGMNQVTPRDLSCSCY